MLRPRPTLPLSRFLEESKRKNGLKTSSRDSFGIPIPSSSMVISIPLAVSLDFISIFLACRKELFKILFMQRLKLFSRKDIFKFVFVSIEILTFSFFKLETIDLKKSSRFLTTVLSDPSPLANDRYPSIIFFISKISLERLFLSESFSFINSISSFIRVKIVFKS